MRSRRSLLAGGIVLAVCSLAPVVFVCQPGLFGIALSVGGLCGTAFTAESGFIPVSEVVRAYDATMLWYPETGRMTLNIPGATLKLVAGSRLVIAGSNSYMMTGAPAFENGAIMIPRDLVENILNKTLPRKFRWDEASGKLSRVEPAATLLGMDLYEDETYTVLKIRADSTISGEIVFPSKREFRMKISACNPGRGFMFPEEGLGLVEKTALARENGAVVLSVSVSGEAESYTVSSDSNGIELRFTTKPNAGSQFLEKTIAKEIKQIRRVVIDPGHGGADPGVIGKRGAKEKDIALDIGLAVKEFLEHNSVLSVLLTRTDDVTMTQDERIEFLQNARADIVVGVHADGYPSSAARGIYVMAPDMEKNLAISLLGTIILDSFSPVIGTQCNGTLTVPLRLFKNPGTKGVVVDCGFLTNPVDEDLLADPKFRNELGTVIGKSLIEFAGISGGR